MRVHAVASIAPGATGTVTASYTYDANGNMLTGRGRTVTWTSFDMVNAITQGTNSVAFTYDSEHARLKQVSSDGSAKTYLNDPTSGAMAERIVGASLSVSWNDYVMLGGEMIALKVSGATTQTRYFHKDHLGSIVALTDETGTVVERDSFDAWGQRRSALGEDDPLYPGQSITSQITRGYTGHQQLDTVGLVHMNGRIYEPVIGKMLSADPTVPNQFDGQSYNRYSYVQNNPLSFTDPTGFYLDLAVEAVSIGLGFNSMVDNFANGNIAAGITDAAGIVADAALAVVPGAPGVVGLGIQGTRLADDVAEQAIKAADEAAEKAVKETAEKASEQAAKNADDAGIGAAENGKKIPSSELKAPPAKRGNAPIGSDGRPVELHHKGQKPTGPLDEMTREKHRGKGNFKKNHENTGQQPSEIDRREWDKERKDYWKNEWDKGRFDDME